MKSYSTILTLSEEEMRKFGIRRTITLALASQKICAKCDLKTRKMKTHTWFISKAEVQLASFVGKYQVKLDKVPVLK